MFIYLFVKMSHRWKKHYFHNTWVVLDHLKCCSRMPFQIDLIRHYGVFWLGELSKTMKTSQYPNFHAKVWTVSWYKSQLRLYRIILLTKQVIAILMHKLVVWKHRVVSYKDLLIEAGSFDDTIHHTCTPVFTVICKAPPAVICLAPDRFGCCRKNSIITDAFSQNGIPSI